jgi:cation diffusion facilitator family transporter
MEILVQDFFQPMLHGRTLQEKRDLFTPSCLLYYTPLFYGMSLFLIFSPGFSFSVSSREKSAEGDMSLFHGLGKHSHHGGHVHSHSPGETGGKTTSVFVISFLVLTAASAFQGSIAVFSGSVSLLSDSFHNVADGLTGLPLWLAFSLATKRPSLRYPYGYGKFEDLAGIFIVGLIFFSAGVSLVRSGEKFFHPQVFQHPGWVTLASLTGFLANEAVASLRIRTGRKTGSISLVADGQHARVDGFTSLTVLVGVAGSVTGHPLWDPVVGMVLGISVLFIALRMMRDVGLHLFDGIEPETLETIRKAAADSCAIRGVSRLRARWTGHSISCDFCLVLDDGVSFRDGRREGRLAEERVRKVLPFAGDVLVVIVPESEAGASPP